MPTHWLESIIRYSFTLHLGHFYIVLVQCVLFQLISVPNVSWGFVPGGMPETHKDFMDNRCREMYGFLRFTVDILRDTQYIYFVNQYLR